MLERLCDRHGIERPIQEYRFHPTRRWRFDYAWVAARVALEVEGGAWTRGRHTRGVGFLEDITKYNQAAALGWRIFRCVPSSVLEVLPLIVAAVRGEVPDLNGRAV